jgi:hypothetical protein
VGVAAKEVLAKGLTMPERHGIMYSLGLIEGVFSFINQKLINSALTAQAFRLALASKTEHGRGFLFATKKGQGCANILLA